MHQVKTPTTASRVAIVGAGFSGAIIARQLADAGVPSIVFEERNHVAGNCHTERDNETGVMVHIYGPHIFHTSREDVWKFVNRFGTFGPYRHEVKAITKRGVFALPLNLMTLNQFFGKIMSPLEAKTFLASLGVPMDPIVSFEDQALKSVGHELYENFFRGYTKKQWGIDPKELPGSILRRLPIRFNFNDCYYDDPYQGIPEEGYTKLVERILHHDLIELRLNSPFLAEVRASYSHVFYSGPIDSFFQYRLGRLGYRTLDFERFRSDGDFQGNSVINYCDEEVPFTRITEFKHFTPWENHEKTTCFKEYSRTCEPGDIPYYPIRLIDEKRLLKEYIELAEQENGVSFVGRLGTYRYLDMHVVVAESLDFSKTYLKCRSEGIQPPRFSVHPL